GRHRVGSLSAAHSDMIVRRHACFVGAVCFLLHLFAARPLVPAHAVSSCAEMQADTVLLQSDLHFFLCAATACAAAISAIRVARTPPMKALDRLSGIVAV